MKYFIRWRNAKIVSNRYNAICLRYYTAPTITSKQAPSLRAETKKYEDIVHEMNTRVKQRSKYTGPPIKTPNFSQHKVGLERYKPLKCGDLVIFNLEPFVVIKTPDTPLENYVLANRVGKAIEVPISSIDSRLLTLLPEGVFLRQDIYAEDAVGAPLGVIEAENNRENTIPQPVVKVVNSWLYSLISKPLSELFEDASLHARQSYSTVYKTLQNMRKENEPVVMPLSHFVEACFGKKMSVTDYYATFMCLDHSKLQQTCKLKVSYMGVDAIQLLPRSSEKRNLASLVEPNNEIDHNRDLLLDYAYQNLPVGDYESRAIEVMRRNYPDLKHIDHSVTADLLLRNSDVAYRHNNWYQWILGSGEPSKNQTKSLAKGMTIGAGLSEDSMSSLRQKYDNRVYCVDEEGSHEIDDGISLEKLSDKHVRLGIHIANPNSGMDLRKNLASILPHCSSVYLHDMTYKLLPEIFTETYSLAENKENSTLSLFGDLNLETGEVSSVKVEALRLTNVKCITPDHFSKSTVENYDLFVQAAYLLLGKRIKNGMVTMKDYTKPELGSIELAFQNIGKAVTTEFMVFANSESAQYAVNHKIPVIFRSQQMLLWSPHIRQLYFNEVVTKDGLVDAQWRSVMRRSHACVDPNEHAGMGTGLATRFTSPLRRLEDLIMHHQLESFLLKDNTRMFTKNELGQMCEQLLLAEGMVKEIHAKDIAYANLNKLMPESKVFGIVYSVGLYSHTKVYLPAYKLEAVYTGTKLLQPYSLQNLTVGKVSPSGSYVTVY